MSESFAQTTFCVDDMSDGTADASHCATTCDSPGDCSLRDAIAAANNASGSDTVDLMNLSGTIKYNQTDDMKITDSVSILGPGADQLTIDADGSQNGKPVFVFDNASGSVSSTIQDLTLINGKGVNGGGIYVASTDYLTLVNCVVKKNNADKGGGIYFEGGQLNIIESTISDNESTKEGGGFYIDSGAPFILFRNSTISGNTASDGGGIYSVDDTVDFSNVTIAENTVDGGQGGGIYNKAATPNIDLRNTLIAGNLTTNGGTSPDCAGSFNSEGYNLVEDTTGCTLSGNKTGNIKGEDPLLDSLADNGGPTPTHALQEGSPAIDAGDPAGCTREDGTTDILIDQRGAARDSNCDIGAFEYVCGNNIVQTEANEECDDGDDNSDTEADACRTDCTAATCGDGVIDSNEKCDDGNTDDGDKCDSTCQKGTGGSSGDGDGGGCSLVRREARGQRL